MGTARIAAALLVATSLASVSAGRAYACANCTTHIESRVLGVDDLGRFLSTETLNARTNVSLRDESGNVIDAILGEPEDGSMRFSVPDENRRERTALGLFHDHRGSLSGVERDLIRELGLKPLVSDARRVRINPALGECGAVEVESAHGFVRVYDISPEGDAEACPTPTVKLYRHPRVNVAFLHLRWRLYRDDGDEMRWFPVSRIDGVGAAMRGAKLRRSGQNEGALSWLGASRALAPEYLPARVDHALALAALGRSEDDVRGVLAEPLPEGTPCIGEQEARAALDREASGRWNVEEMAVWRDCRQFGHATRARDEVQTSRDEAPSQPGRLVLAPLPPVLVPVAEVKPSPDADVGWLGAIAGVVAGAALVILAPKARRAVRRRRRDASRHTGSPYRTAP